MRAACPSFCAGENIALASEGLNRAAPPLRIFLRDLLAQESLEIPRLVSPVITRDLLRLRTWAARSSPSINVRTPDRGVVIAGLSGALAGAPSAANSREGPTDAVEVERVSGTFAVANA